MSTQSQLGRLGLFDARVPRYTSYPTAPHFNTDIDGGAFSRWVGAIAPGARISLYIHIPFCRRLCWFCACRTQGTRSEAPVRAYVETLKSEIALMGTVLPPGVRLGRLHWGGGTPTLLAPDMIADLAGAIFSVAPLAEDGEFSVEIDPNEIDAPRLESLAKAGMTRASLGVQDFDPEIQAAIGREQGYDITREVVDALRAQGVASLNADILYGLPYQTRARVADSVQKLMSLSPDRVALYGYAHVPWMARRQQMIPSESLPRPEERLELFDTARRLFVWDGYDEIGIDHFARPDDGLARAARNGRLRRNFQGYTDDSAPVLVGLGASAISRFPQGYAQNAPSTSDYTRDVRAGRFATARGHAFTGDDLLRGQIIESLMCTFRIDYAALAAEHGVTPDHVAQLAAPAVRKFAGFVEAGPQALTILPEGRPLARMIAREFDAYGLSKAGHSSAV
ncbi:oxygen-independent coproporphyrinogen III oxidase [Rhodobacteraceae bacterium WD3A24]|nr:oxygen-independent coproporphyrinogen III oxidase [Rhodobacteraceae bacterium WD3A24]